MIRYDYSVTDKEKTALNENQSGSPVKGSVVTMATANSGSPAKPTDEAAEPSEEAFNDLDGEKCSVIAKILLEFVFLQTFHIIIRFFVGGGGGGQYVNTTSYHPAYSNVADLITLRITNSTVTV